MYIHSVSFLYIDMVQVVEILPCWRQEPIDSTVNTMVTDNLPSQKQGAIPYSVED